MAFKVGKLKDLSEEYDIPLSQLVPIPGSSGKKGHEKARKRKRTNSFHHEIFPNMVFACLQGVKVPSGGDKRQPERRLPSQAIQPARGTRQRKFERELNKIIRFKERRAKIFCAQVQ